MFRARGKHNVLFEKHPGPKCPPPQRLFDDLWGERPPPTARNPLHNCISALRRALGDEVIVTAADGYSIAVAADGLDSARFERLVAEARAEESDERRGAMLLEAL